jgi:ABC-type Na+ efflux pump permease subunit
MRKIALVAHREFMENARTKSFWIGILIFPIMLGLFFIVPQLLEKTKSARKYAVVDQSGWLVEAVEREIVRRDLTVAFRSAGERYQIAPTLQAIAQTLAELDDEQLVLAARLVVFGGQGQEPGRERRALSADAVGALEQDAPGIRTWIESLTESDAKRYAPGSSRERYVRVPVSGAAASPDSLGQRVVANELFGYFVIGTDPVTDNAGSRYISNNLTDSDLRDWFSSLASAQVQARRLEREQIDAGVARWIQSPVLFEARKVSGAGEEEAVEAQDRLRQWAPVVFVYLLWISVFTVAQMLLTNTVEEKSNRIIEVLLSSVSPVELMAGKIAGIAITGLAIVGSWMAVFFLGTKYIPKLLDASGMPDLSALAGDPVYVGSFLVYFLLGYLLFAAFLVGIGAVCTTLKEAQNLMGPVTLLLIVPLMSMIPIGRDPNGTLAKVMSFIPPFTPFVMMNRAAGPPTPLEYLLTASLLVVSIVAALWAAAKVFRIGILLTGKPPKLREIFRWIRAPVGMVPQRKG